MSMINHTVRRFLEVPLTPVEVDERHGRVVVLLGDIEQRRVDAKNAAKKAKEEIEILENEASIAAKEARDRATMRDVSCTWRADYARGEAVLVRSDTGHIVERRGLQDDEIQTSIFEGDGGDVTSIRGRSEGPRQ